MAVGREVIILTLAWLSQVFSEMGELPAPINVTITSRNFIHLLTWQPGPGPPRGASYNVSVSSDRERSWVPVAGCVLVERPLVCNLTTAFTNPTHVYYSMVVAVLRNQASHPAYAPGFKPIKDGELAAPRLTLAVCERSLCVDLHPPLESVRDLYQGFQYQLHVTTNTSDQPVKFTKSTWSLDRHVLSDLPPGRQYCVSVRILDSQIPRKFSKPQCILTPSTVGTEDMLLVVFCLVVVGVVLCGAVVFLLTRAGKLFLKNPLPSVLVRSVLAIATLFMRLKRICWVLALTSVCTHCGVELHCKLVQRPSCADEPDAKRIRRTFIHPLREGRLAISRKEPICFNIHIGAASPSAGGKGTCAARGVCSTGDQVWSSGSAASVEGYRPFSSSSSSSSSSSFSTLPLLAPPLNAECPPRSQGPVSPHRCAHSATLFPSCRRSERGVALCDNASTTPRSVAVATLDQHALQPPRCVDPSLRRPAPPAPLPEEQADTAADFWEGGGDVNIFSLTLGDCVEDEAYGATPPPSTDEDEDSTATIMSFEDEEADEEQPDGYLQH